MLLILFLFFVFIYHPAKKLYCKRVVEVKIANFSSAAYRLGVIPIEEEKQHIGTITKVEYEKCIL